MHIWFQKWSEFKTGFEISLGALVELGGICRSVLSDVTGVGKIQIWFAVGREGEGVCCPGYRLQFNGLLIRVGEDLVLFTGSLSKQETMICIDLHQLSEKGLQFECFPCVQTTRVKWAVCL